MPRPKPHSALEIGERVYLREPTAADRDEMIVGNRASRRLHRGWVTPPIDAPAYRRWMRRCRLATVRCLLVCRLEDDAITGVFALSQIVRGFFQSAYLGYYALEPFTGQGYMREGLQLTLRYAFTTMKLHRVEANIQPENAASIALARRAGFRLEGYSPRYLKVAGRWRDHQRWAILIDDWRRLRRPRRATSRRPARRAPPASASRGKRRSG
ncbi:MAG TPA: GNAT family protein [Candidatus Dormibacteraeota bacterium]